MSQRVCPAVSGAGGATGMIGQGLLRECLLDERIARMARIETVGRRKPLPSGAAKPLRRTRESPRPSVPTSEEQ